MKGKIEKPERKREKKVKKSDSVLEQK